MEFAAGAAEVGGVGALDAEGFEIVLDVLCGGGVGWIEMVMNIFVIVVRVDVVDGVVGGGDGIARRIHHATNVPNATTPFFFLMFFINHIMRFQQMIIPQQDTSMFLLSLP